MSETASTTTRAYHVTPGTRVLYGGRALTITGMDAPYYSRVIARTDDGRQVELDMLALVIIPGPPGEAAVLALPEAA